MTEEKEEEEPYYVQEARKVIDLSENLMPHVDRPSLQFVFAAAQVVQAYEAKELLADIDDKLWSIDRGMP